jgi:molybdenum cofactor synthesis domain-containing protein
VTGQGAPPLPDGGAARGAAYVLTVSDRSARGERPDMTGNRLAARLGDLGYSVERGLVQDDEQQIAAAVERACQAAALIVITGGTGLTPRDVTPQAIRSMLKYEIPGLGERMRAAGRATTPHADLSRSLGGVVGTSLVLALPGSPTGALESLGAVEALLPHALDMLGGAGDHRP